MKTKFYRVTLDALFFVGALFTTSMLFSQTVLMESSKSMQTFTDGTVNIRGSLAFRDSSFQVTSDDQNVNVGALSYLRIEADVFTAATRTVLLSNGLVMGQILFLECTGGSWELQDFNNLEIQNTRTFSEGDTMQLLWNGTKWLELHYSDNG